MPAVAAHPLSARYLQRRLSFGLFDLYDEKDALGTPILEGRSVRYPVPGEALKICRYADSRKGGSFIMNASALNRFRVDRQAVMRKVQSAILETWMPTTRTFEPGSLMHIWRIACYGRISPLLPLMQSKALGAVVPPLEPAVATWNKLTLGVSDLIMAAIIAGHDAQEKMSGDELYALADRTGRLVGAKEVCPAPPALIVGVLDEIIELCSSPVNNHISEGTIAEVHQRLVMTSIHRHLSELFATYEALRLFGWRRLSNGSQKTLVKSRHASPFDPLARDAAILCLPLKHSSLISLRELTFSSGIEASVVALFAEFSSRADSLQALLASGFAPVFPDTASHQG